MKNTVTISLEKYDELTQSERDLKMLWEEDGVLNNLNYDSQTINKKITNEHFSRINLRI